ncbi:DUF262 domain-containing protein [Listeria monocytogenes]|uniref:DUF262 domain-containing protein n=1 Tax=Listeria monocytogenes TaxID=1639 RepID=UPI000874768C|nr:DUF262 domain-containing protein [Listeria monocytogenes]EAD3232985.1 DUF262 domain-containing protein [Listeria monocytogenes]EAF6088031.1 DUF262 domain-containing protein [Listeria monocytogenes]EFN3773403.1 DUF262 domain-containing protein [Listeria monocytogenes]EKZ1003357.1 DUF262 domain-containing protein [Listeria monocytogenes]EKZ1009022.1 DUF262 domain-containing protein [Listeria monocytogenes]
MSIINSNFRSLGSYIMENIYKIPNYQREYSWEETELEDLWMDLSQIINGETESHFFGQIVIHVDKKEKAKLIIDGQQRTSTAVIFLAAMRDLFTEMYNAGWDDAQFDAQDITTKFIGRYTQTRDERKLILGENDKSYFSNRIQSVSSEQLGLQKATKSQKRINFAYNYFYKKLEEEINSSDFLEDKYGLLKTFFITFTEKCSVMFVETDDFNEAFIIFETLNARGKDLETADLLKNHLFKIANKKVGEVKKNWKQMLEFIGTVDTTKYIRHFWNSQNVFIREKDLYKEIRKKITTQFEAIIFIDDLVRLSEVYGGMKNPAEDNFFETDSQQVLNDLKRLGAKSFYPIILAMVKKDYGPNEIYEVLSAIEVLVVRNFVISGLVANKYETEFSKIAFKIYQEEVESVTEIINLIRTNIIADDVFLNNFSSFKTTNKLRLRYILKKINDSYSKEIAVLNDNNKIHLEHIMPIKADGWDIIKEEHEEYLWKIGNLTLLGSEYNKKSTNKIFNDKKDIYEYSEVQLTRKLLDYDEWNIDVIKERQVELAELAVNIWKV